jgi:hypothetical protein
MALVPETPIDKLTNRPVDAFSRDEIESMWYDWFCKETSLNRKGRFLLQRLQGLVPSPRFNAETSYVFFKNNLPLYGKMYDSFSICKIGSGDVLYWVAPALGYKIKHFEGKASVGGIAPDTGEFEADLIVGTWFDVKAFFRETDPAKVLDMINKTRRYIRISVAEIENEERDRELAYAKRQAERQADEVGREYRERLQHLLDF